MNIPRVLLLTLVVFPLLVSAQGGSPTPLFPFVLPWDDASAGVTNVSAWNEKPAGNAGFITAQAGHLYAGKVRIRFLGVNLCFGACFPTHADAEKIAARMAKFGINCVRFHHMDMYTAPTGIFQPDMRTLDAGQLDKLDYLIAQLKAQGIYVDLNLHVSRAYPGQPTWDGMPGYCKGVDNFYPPMIALQRDYARDLLTHRNPYTKTYYVDEPAVAFIEINNENGLLYEWWNGSLEKMPPAIADALVRQWNAWLRQRYADTAALKAAWKTREEPEGAEMLSNADFRAGTTGWYLEQHGTAKATATVAPDGPDGQPTLRLDVGQVDGVDWHVQLTQTKLRFQQGKPYTFSFRAKADKPRTLSVSLMQAHDPWRVLSSQSVSLGTTWQTYRLTVVPADDEADGRITFSRFGAQTGAVWLAGVSIKPGGMVGLRPGETLGAMGLFTKSDYARTTTEAQRDWITFLWSVEEGYWTGMSRFLKEDLKAHGLIIGSQTSYSPAPLQGQLDVVDAHAYWQHPHFPGRPWDPANWFVTNTPMAGVATGGTLPGLALGRITGKPFVVTEYNHAAPNTYASEGFLLLAAYAALQDWDGIFAFAYSHRKDDWNPQRIPSFFDIDAHPAKMATLPAAAAIFRRGDVRASTQPAAVPVTLEMVKERLRVAGPWISADQFGLPRMAALQRGVGMTIQPQGKPAKLTIPTPPKDAIASDTAELDWQVGDRGLMSVSAPRSRVLIARCAPGNTYTLRDVTIRTGETAQQWAVLSLTVMEGKDFASPGRLLLTATGTADNTGMGWKNAEKTSVGRDWGQAPSRVEGIAATVLLPVPAARVQAWALDERGQRREPLPVRDERGTAALAIGPAYRTLWYEIALR